MDHLIRPCRLVKRIPAGEQRREVLLPSEFARTGHILKLKEGDAWDDGWVIDLVGPPVYAPVQADAGWAETW